MARNYLFARKTLRFTFIHFKVLLFFVFVQSSRLISAYHVLAKKAIVLFNFIDVIITTLTPIVTCSILLFVLLWFLQRLVRFVVIFSPFLLFKTLSHDFPWSKSRFASLDPRTTFLFRGLRSCCARPQTTVSRSEKGASPLFVYFYE